jgi:hypothetical protein
MTQELETYIETKSFKLEFSRFYIKNTFKMYAKYVSKSILKTLRTFKTLFKNDYKFPRE